MRNFGIILAISAAFLSIAANGATDKQFDKKTICEITLNSTEEKQVFEQRLTPLGYQGIELAPENDKDLYWLDKACKAINSCDILVISGHFGGLFFGQGIATTLPLQQLLTAKQNHSCPSLLDTPKQVYLMGCNTLASKKADHRSVEEYLSVLVEDGFPLNLAEQVAASRYLNFGRSLQQTMSKVFDRADLIVGFDGKAPLGKYTEPLLKKAFDLTDKKTLTDEGLSAAALKTAFQGTALTSTIPQAPADSQLEAQAKNYISAEASEKSWLELIKKDQLSAHYDFILENQNNPALFKILRENEDARATVKEGFLNIFKLSHGLAGIQIKVLRFLLEKELIDADFFQDQISKTVDSIVAKGIQYVSAGQLCSIFKENSVSLSAASEKAIEQSNYASFLDQCRGKELRTEMPSQTYSCLIHHDNHDWGCLQQNNAHLDVKSCLLASSRNEDRENGDDMLWYCYTHLRDSGLITKPKCLDLTTHFNLLGNQLKMNWNCMKNVSGE